LTFEELTAEYSEVGIGPLILREIRELAWMITRSYDPEVYANVPRWDEGIDDLVQEFGSDVLIGQGQLDYAMMVATDYKHFRRLLALQIRHLLARRRRRTVVDNLLIRSRRIVADPPFRMLAHRSEWSYTLEHREVEPGRPTPTQTRDVAARLASVPVVRCAPRKRAPVVYSEESLRTILCTTAASIACAVRSTDLDRIFGLLLTSWVPRFVNRGEKAVERAVAVTLSAEEHTMVNEVSRSILRSCTGIHREVLHLKLTGMSDQDIAGALRLSRPTISKRKREALSLLEAALDGLGEAAKLAIVDRLAVSLLRAGGAE
jgi:hypothetical protein